MNPLAKLILKNCIVGKSLFKMTGLYHLGYSYLISSQLHDFEAVKPFAFQSPVVSNRLLLCRQQQPASLRCVCLTRDRGSQIAGVLLMRSSGSTCEQDYLEAIG